MVPPDPFVGNPYIHHKIFVFRFRLNAKILRAVQYRILNIKKTLFLFPHAFVQTGILQNIINQRCQLSGGTLDFV